jgi:hypothetical protein
MMILHEWLGGSGVIDLDDNQDVYDLYQVIGVHNTADLLVRFENDNQYNVVIQANPTDITTVHQFTRVSEDFEG